MDLLSDKEFEFLAQANDVPCVSIFIPLEQEVDKHDENRIRLKNQLATAEKKLQDEYKLRPNEITRILEPATRLISGGRFSAAISDGLALFLAPELSRIYSLPVSFSEQIIIGSHFYLRPILPLFMEDCRFYILALSQNEIRLLQATAHSVHEVILAGDIPGSLEEALKWEDPERQLQWHSGTSAPPTRNRRAIFHGHSVTSEETQKKNIAEYFRQLAAGIDDLLQDQKVPLVLAGVDYLLPIYRSAAGYPHLLDTGISGSPEQLSAQELRDRAWEKVAPLYKQIHLEAAQHFAAQAETGLAVDGLDQVVAAAHFGLVDVLFLAENSAQIWGTFDAEQAAIIPQSSSQTPAEELLDRSAVQTILNGGTVYILPTAEMPGAKDQAALLRAPVNIPT